MYVTCGRCHKGGEVGKTVYSCGSTGNINNPSEILWLHYICPDRQPRGECSQGNHKLYHGSCHCDEPESCSHCHYCRKCEQYETFRNASSIYRGFKAVGKVIDSTFEGDQ